MLFVFLSERFSYKKSHLFIFIFFSLSHFHRQLLVNSSLYFCANVFSSLCLQIKNLSGPLSLICRYSIPESIVLLSNAYFLKIILFCYVLSCFRFLLFDLCLLLLLRMIVLNFIIHFTFYILSNIM